MLLAEGERAQDFYLIRVGSVEHFHWLVDQGVPFKAGLWEEPAWVPPTDDGLTKAIAAFERTIIAMDAPYDRYQAGDTSAMSDAAVCVFPPPVPSCIRTARAPERYASRTRSTSASW